jgi:uncharacterized iron-regulated membrane protein
MSVWAISGVYFVWPERFVAVVNAISKAPNAAPPAVHVAEQAKAAKWPVEALVANAMKAEPGAKLQGISYGTHNQPFAVMLTRTDVTEFLHTTWVYLDPANGKIAGFWHAGKRETAGDWFIWLMAPLHFGMYWGLGVKILWAFLGILLPLLAITGVLMYWNRYLSKKWRMLVSWPGE